MGTKRSIGDCIVCKSIDHVILLIKISTGYSNEMFKSLLTGGNISIFKKYIYVYKKSY